MYTFDLLRAELLIQLANSAANLRKESNNTTFHNRTNDVAAASLEEAKRLILEAKPDGKQP